MTTEEDENQQSKESFITPEGHKRIVDELEQLWRFDRPKIVDEVAAAAAQGDRSENAEYIYGKKKLREIDRRLQFLERRLKACKVIDPVAQKGNLVDFGATVTVENDDGQKRVYYIVGVDEADPSRRMISYRSPIGRALLGKKVGDYVDVETPNGQIGLTVIKFDFVGHA